MEESNEYDYPELGLKCGLEIHQQLDTKKLFCECPGVLRKDEPDYEVNRKLHAVAGESGDIDAAAKHEAELKKSFVYQGYHDNVCLVELDEEPPHEIDNEALETGLHIALLLNAKPLPITQIMRKTVIDGSNTSGFQRTVLIAREGYVETNHGKVRVESICLEEDAARIIERKENSMVYRLDRLGIPLVEITTSPDIKNPEQAREAALKIGEVLRACKVKRGIGTIRQDVNVSVSGGVRTELKGVQDPDLITKAINKEIERQLNALDQKNSENVSLLESGVRNALEDGNSRYLRPMPGAARMYPETDLPLLRVSRDFINKSKKNLPKTRDEIKKELRKKGLSEEMIKLLFKQNKLEEFKELLEVYNKPEIVAKTLLVFPREIGKKKNLLQVQLDERLTQDVFEFVLDKLNKKELSESQIKEVLERIIDGESFSEAVKFDKADIDEIEERVMKILKEKPGLNANAYMGLVMKEFKGKISGKEAMDIIKKYV